MFTTPSARLPPAGSGVTTVVHPRVSQIASEARTHFVIAVLGTGSPWIVNGELDGLGAGPATASLFRPEEDRNEPGVLVGPRGLRPGSISTRCGEGSDQGFHGYAVVRGGGTAAV